MYRNRPTCVLIVMYFLDSSSKSTCWYAEDKSSLVNFSPPFNWVNRSLAVGIGCFGTSKTVLIVTLESPQIQTLPSGFSTGTMGVAQSETPLFPVHRSFPVFEAREQSSLLTIQQSSPRHCVFFELQMCRNSFNGPQITIK